MKHVTRLLAVLVVGSMCLLNGCLESSFTLANDSRLPTWVKLPPMVQREDVSLTLNYYSTPFGPNAKFVLKNKQGAILQSLSGNDKPIGNNLSGYPRYVKVVVRGVPEIIEHRAMEPIFYISDNPVIRNKALAVK